jgi:hypothetical protein
MMAAANADDAAHVEQLQPFTGSYGRRHVADEAFQSPSGPEDANKDVAGGYPGETAVGEFDVAVGGRFAEGSDNDHVAGTRFGGLRHNCDLMRQVEPGRGRADLIDPYDV